MSTNLTKREIVLEIYRKAGFPQKQIVDTVQQTLDIVQKALSEGRNVELRNFGVLEVQVRKQRVVKFKAGKILKQQLKKLDLTTLL
jgi:integration host factor subunit beta